jgi:carbonic anhydrase/acetyltransferase-like protein (isoleucine patch superfamily)
MSSSAQTTSSADSQTRVHLSSTTSVNTGPHPKPPLEIHPTAHLDPQAYIQGIFPINLGAHVIIHPRARLVSVYGPLSIGAGTVISERCIVGGPGPDPRSPLPPPPEVPLKTFLGHDVVFQAAAEVQAGSSIDDASLIEPQALIMSGLTVGKHTKVCAGCQVDRSIGDWVVVWGDGQQRRKRIGAEEAENGRLKALEREREATAALLKATAAKATLGKRRG